MTDNTINSLRVLQVGVEAVKATGTLTMDTQPTADDTVTIGSVTYTWKNDATPDPGQIHIGANIAAAKVNFVAAVNGTDGFQAGPNPFASASAFSGDVSTLTARQAGPAGTTVATTETFTAVTNIFNATTLGATIEGVMARGTAVAATSRLAVEQLEWSDEDENVYQPQVANGILMRHQGPGTAVQHGTRFSLPDQAMIWEQMPLWFSMLMGAPTITGSLGGPYTFVWTVSPSTNPSPYSVTLQRRFSNGLGNNIDERATYAMLSDLGLSFAANEQLRLSGGGGFARKFETSAITSGLTLPDFEVGVSALSSIYFDTLFSDVGDTLLSEQVIGWTWNFTGGMFPRPTAEGRTTLDFTKHQINGSERGITMEVQCLLDPTTYAAELTRAATPATNQFAVRVKVVGTDSRSLTIDQLMQHDKPLWAPGVDQGQDVVTFSLLDATDGTDALVVTLILPDTYAVA
jgi:hypothetical protein